MTGSDHKATQSLAIYPIRQGGVGGGTREAPRPAYGGGTVGTGRWEMVG